MVSRVQIPGLAYAVTDVLGLDSRSVMYTVSEGTTEGGSTGIDGILFGAWNVEGEVVPLLFGTWIGVGLEFEPNEEAWIG